MLGKFLGEGRELIVVLLDGLIQRIHLPLQKEKKRKEKKNLDCGDFTFGERFLSVQKCSVENGNPKPFLPNFSPCPFGK